MPSQADSLREPSTGSSFAQIAAPVAEVIDASYTYAGGRKRASRRIGPLNLRVHAGERIAVIGPNGCGKSTLINLLSGASTPDEGCIRWFDDDLTLEARGRIGVVFQSPSLDALLTVRETLLLAGRLLRMNASDIEHRKAELVDELGIADRIDSRIGTLSGGLARRVDLARAIMHEPELVLLDEPTAVLDDESAAAFNAMLDRLTRAGVAVVAATHTLEEVRLSHRVAVIIDGHVAIDEPVDDVPADASSQCITITGDAERLSAILDEHNVPAAGTDAWRLDLAGQSDASIAAILRAAIQAGGQVKTPESSMHGYFVQAERRLAAARASEPGGSR